MTDFKILVQDQYWQNIYKCDIVDTDDGFLEDRNVSVVEAEKSFKLHQLM